MVCYALFIPDDDSVYIRRRFAISAKVRALDLATYLYILYPENHSERLQLPAGLVLPWYSRYIIRGPLPGLHRSRWVYHLIHWCLLLADQYSTWISNISSRWHLHNWATSAKLVRQTLWIDHLYVGNPNIGLRFNGNLFEGARAWYFHVVGETGATYSLPSEHSILTPASTFCTWYVIANTVLGYGMNTSCIKAIKSTYNIVRDPRPSAKREWASI